MKQLKTELLLKRDELLSLLQSGLMAEGHGELLRDKEVAYFNEFKSGCFRIGIGSDAKPGTGHAIGRIGDDMEVCIDVTRLAKTPLTEDIPETQTHADENSNNPPTDETPTE
jgi:hypothetical protein